MSKEEALARLRELASLPDIETAHCEADDCLMEFLRELGFSDVADAFDKIEKWYS